MPSQFSYIFILVIGIGLVIGAAYFMSDASTSRSVILESRRLEYQTIENLRNPDPAEYTSRRWKIDNRYDAELNINMLQKEVGAWGSGIFGILLIMLGILDMRLHLRRSAQHQKGILYRLVESNIDDLLSKKSDAQSKDNNDKWEFEKSLFIEKVFIKEDTGKLMFKKEELSTMIDQIMDGNLK